MQAAASVVVLGLRYDDIELYMTNDNRYFFFSENQSVWDIAMDDDLKTELKHALYSKYHNQDNKAIGSVTEFDFSDFEEGTSYPVSNTVHSQQCAQFFIDNKISPYTPFSSILSMTQDLFNLDAKTIRQIFNSYSKSSVTKPKPRNHAQDFFSMIQDVPSNFQYVHIKHKFKNDSRWQLLTDVDRRKYFRIFNKLRNPSELQNAKQSLNSLLSRTNANSEEEILGKIEHKLEWICLPGTVRESALQEHLEASMKST
eukprot:NODE_599_length_6258_cov_0.597987.p3 type:complete len:256 gc:universal NODE_599_length_6258_cov_0.597987:2508-3275(+)